MIINAATFVITFTLTFGIIKYFDYKMWEKEFDKTMKEKLEEAKWNK